MKHPLLRHLYKLKRKKSPIQNPVVHQQKLVLLMNIDHLAVLIAVFFEESFANILKEYLLYQYISLWR